MAAQLETREVAVLQVNGNGFKSTDGDWLNFSKFVKASDVVMPTVGERVTVTIDKAGFVRKIAPAALPVAPATPAPAEAVIFPTAIAQDDRGIVVTRLAVLNTATAIPSSGARAVTPDEVLALAARLEAWATR